MQNREYENRNSEWVRWVCRTGWSYGYGVMVEVECVELVRILTGRVWKELVRVQRTEYSAQTDEQLSVFEM